MAKINLAIIDERIGHMHKDIKEVKKHVKETNGRVGELEKWKAFLTGGIVISCSVVGVLWTIFIYFINKFI